MEATAIASGIKFPTTVTGILRPDHRRDSKDVTKLRPPYVPRAAAVTTQTDKILPNLSGGGSSGAATYQDNWIDRIAIDHFSNCIQAVAGIECETKGYERLLEATRTLSSENFNPIHQRELSMKAVDKAFPKQFLYLIKMILLQIQSKFSREMCAAFTTLFFSWLVGPSQVKEGDFNGRKEKHIVHIKKCRFLEGSKCVGMCINMCKFPTQTFIRDSLGMPVNMVPNFDDMSCEMIFGEEPPEPNDDPVSKQPCYAQCKIKRRHVDGKCSK